MTSGGFMIGVRNNSFIDSKYKTFLEHWDAIGPSFGGPKNYPGLTKPHKISINSAHSDNFCFHGCPIDLNFCEVS